MGTSGSKRVSEQQRTEGRKTTTLKARPNKIDNKGRSFGDGSNVIGGSRRNPLKGEALLPYYQIECEALHHLTDNDNHGWEIKDTVAHLPPAGDSKYSMKPMELSINNFKEILQIDQSISEMDDSIILNESQLKILDEQLIKHHSDFGKPAIISILCICSEQTSPQSPASRFIESVTAKKFHFINNANTLLCAVPYLQQNCILFDIPCKVLENKEDRYWQKIINYVGIAIGTLCSLIIVEDMLLLKSWLINDYEVVLHSFYNEGMVPPLVIVHDTGKITSKQDLSNFTANLMHTFGGNIKWLSDTVFYLEDKKQYKHFILASSNHDDSISQTFNVEVKKQIEIMITRQQSVSFPKSKSTLGQITQAISLGFSNMFSLPLKCNIIAKVDKDKLRLFIKLTENQINWNNLNLSNAYQTHLEFEYYHKDDKLVFLLETSICVPLIQRKSDRIILVTSQTTNQHTKWKMPTAFELPLSSVYLDKPKYYYYSEIGILMMEFKKLYEIEEIAQQILIDV